MKSDKRYIHLDSLYLAVQMDVPFVTFQYRDLKVFRVLYLQGNRDFQNKLIIFLDPPGKVRPNSVPPNW